MKEERFVKSQEILYLPDNANQIMFSTSFYQEIYILDYFYLLFTFWE